jgi:hypothetical protein
LNISTSSSADLNERLPFLLGRAQTSRGNNTEITRKKKGAESQENVVFKENVSAADDLIWSNYK